MLALLDLLDMDAGSAGSDVAAPDALGEVRTILESASSVDISYHELGIQSPGASGFIGYGTAETKYRRRIVLDFANVQWGSLRWLELHYKAWLLAGAPPFEYRLPITSASFYVEYVSAPALNHVGRQGGNTAQVVLEEVFLTD